MFKTILILSLLLSACLALQKVRYDNYKVFRIDISNVQQMNLLKEMENSDQSYSFWKSPKAIGTFADIVVPPHKLDEIDFLIQKFELKAETIIDDLQQLIESEKVGTRSDALDWEAYYPLENIHNFMKDTLRENPGIVKFYESSRSYENRPVYGMGISYKEGNEAIFIEANIHAR